ncbi:MAG: hypothetical protein ACI8P9_000958 [Parasphingorhabdus sp.]
MGKRVDWCQKSQMLTAYDEDQMAIFEAKIPEQKEFEIPAQILTPA